VEEIGIPGENQRPVNVLIDELSELVISAEDEAIINIKKGKDRQ
jgi:hypothetical protein